MSKVLDRDEIDRIIMKLPSVVDRGKLFSHVAILEDSLKGAEETTEKGDDTLVVSWIRKTWPTQTVRAKMAQKIARLIEEGEHKKA